MRKKVIKMILLCMVIALVVFGVSKVFQYEVMQSDTVEELSQSENAKAYTRAGRY